MNKSKEVLVLFSGGRDSSATAVLLAKMGYRVRLFTCQSGSGELVGPRGDSAPDIRHKELLKSFPKNIDQQRIIKDDSYLIRKMAVEKTNKEHVVYPLALALSTHSMAIDYCLKNKIKTMASGYSGYQADKDKYIEQRSDFVLLTRKFLKEYDISYITPVIDKSEMEVKDVLEQHGISSNSLESKDIFSGIPFDKTKALKFWQSAVPVCREFLKNV